MKCTTCSLIVASLVCFFSSILVHSEEYWPTDEEWNIGTPESVSMDTAGLEAAIAFAKENNSLSLLILREGKIVVEQYWGEHTADTRKSIASATKSMTAFMIGMALEDGKFTSIDQSIADFCPTWKDTPKQQITLRHMLSMTSGLIAKGFPVSNVTQQDQFTLNATMPLEAKPGMVWRYNTPAYHMLFRLLEKATGESMEEYAEKRLFGPLGMKNTEWAKDVVGDVTNYYRLKCTARDMGRFGLLALRGGRWKDEQLVPSEFYKAALTPSQEFNRSYGYLWWLNSEKGKGSSRNRAQFRLRFPECPSDTIACMGAGGQNIIAVPSKDLVVIRQGKMAKNARFPAELLKMIVDSIE